MVDAFDKREIGFEAKLSHDNDLRFLATARGIKKVGLWAAELMGFSERDAEGYAQTIVSEGFLATGNADIFKIIRKDFDAARINKSDHQIRRTLREMFAVALEEVQNG